MTGSTKGRPESKIPKFIKEREKPPAKKRKARILAVKGPAGDEVARAIFHYCVLRTSLDVDLLTSKEKTTILRLIRKMIPKVKR